MIFSQTDENNCCCKQSDIKLIWFDIKLVIKNTIRNLKRILWVIFNICRLWSKKYHTEAIDGILLIYFTEIHSFCEPSHRNYLQSYQWNRSRKRKIMRQIKAKEHSIDLFIQTNLWFSKMKVVKFTATENRIYSESNWTHWEKVKW